MKKAKCSSCGAPLEFNDDKKTGTCPYCQSRYIFDEEKEKKAIARSDKQLDTSTRPKLNTLLVVLLWISCFPLCIGYIIYTMYKQHEWDNNHNKK